MTDVEERWGKALKDTEVSSFGAFWGRVSIGLIVGGLASWFGRSFFLVPMAVAFVGCIYAVIVRRQKVERREELVNLLINKLSNGMLATEFVAVLSALCELGPSAAKALPLIGEIEKANTVTPEIQELCAMARARITAA